MKRMKVDKLGIDLLTHDPVIILRDTEGHRYLPILIGPFEATAIALALEGATVPRPLSHDLMKNIITSLGAKVLSVQINDLQNRTFLAKVVVELNGKVVEIDARPSDSIALALRMNAPIYVSDKIILEEAIIERSSSDGHSEGLTESKEQQKFKKYIDNLKPSDFLKGFENLTSEKQEPENKDTPSDETLKDKKEHDGDE